MLSFGIEYDFAFSIAFCSARLLAGSPPPSFAATMIARESFEKIWPRFLSAAPFLCLIEDHLECPDTHPSLRCGARVRIAEERQEPLVQAVVPGQLGVERRHHDTALGRRDRLLAVPGEDVHRLSDPLDARCADEHAGERLGVAGERQRRLERAQLAA